jgi:hypothetical protein
LFWKVPPPLPSPHGFLLCSKAYCTAALISHHPVRNI